MRAGLGHSVVSKRKSPTDKAKTPAATVAPEPIAVPVETKAKRGRPTDYTAELGHQICDAIASRVPLVELCEQPDMPCERTVYRWLRQHDEFSQQYARAREHRADARLERIDEISRKVESGALEPNAARVMLDAIKWQMSKENAKRYGDKVALTDGEGGPVKVQFVR